MMKPIIQVERYKKGNFDQETGNLIAKDVKVDLEQYLKGFQQFINTHNNKNNNHKI